MQIALKNAQKHDCKDKIIFLHGDLFKPFMGRIKQNSLDAIISNPPYINSYDFKSLSPEIKNNEPKIALSGGIDGLDYYRKIIKKSPYYLTNGGFIALEVGINQSKTVKELIIRENSFNQEIEIVDVRIKRVDLPPENEKFIFDRMRAERERIAKQYRAEGQEESAKIIAETEREKTVILAEAYKTAQTLRGEGEAESIKIYAESFNQDPEFYKFYRTLEAYTKTFKDKTTVLLSTDSEFLKYLNKP
ncbi:Release factor glutamine methyltransferase [subsurface metagenome]